MAKLEDPEELIMPEQERHKVESARSTRIGRGKVNTLSSDRERLAGFSTFPRVCDRPFIDPNLRLFLACVLPLVDFTNMVGTSNIRRHWPDG
jgi:hypothetical protein